MKPGEKLAPNNKHPTPPNTKKKPRYSAVVGKGRSFNSSNPNKIQKGGES